MGSYSIHSINEADPPKWQPGEDIASAAFVGITLYLFVEVNFSIFRAFKKRRGLYFWSMQIGSLGILMESVGIILKYFATPSTNATWPLYTLFIVVGWGIYCTAQSLVLYSRLHLVTMNYRLQRYVLYMIVSTIFTFVLPHLIFVWPAYNTSSREMSSLWSPREAIAQRYTQIGYTITESIISGLYIWALIRLLGLKSNVRQRRVMTDLIYVNVVVVAFDILEVALVYTNLLGFSQCIQSFSYIFKLRIEFAVLNQLMDVAARGMHRGSFGKDRYYRTANQEDMPSHDDSLSREAENPHITTRNDSPKDPAEAALPSSLPSADFISPPNSTHQLRRTNRSGSDVSDVRIFGPESDPISSWSNHTGISDRKSSSSDRHHLTQRAKLGESFFDKLPQPSKHFNNRSSGRSKDLVFQRHNRSHRGNSDDIEDDGEKIELQMWDRCGTAVVDIPWFRSKVEV